jgi:DNA-nicking Smr family endonuclease
MADEPKDKDACVNRTPLDLPIDGVLDLHTFRPQDVKELVPEYLRACREKNILRVRIIHGKGIGNLRRTVHALLGRDPTVLSFALASESFGGWGATIVHLHPTQSRHGH